MDHKVSKDMISSGMIPSGEKTQADLGRTQYGSAPSPSKLMDAYKSMYEHHKKDADGNTIPHEGEELNEGKIPAGLQAYLDKKKGKKEDKKDMKEEVDTYDIVLDHFLNEGYKREDIIKVMSTVNLTEEPITATLATIGVGLMKGAAVAGKAAMAAGKAGLAATKGIASAGAKGLAAGSKAAMKGVVSAAKPVTKSATAVKDLAGKGLSSAKDIASKGVSSAKDMASNVGQQVKKVTSQPTGGSGEDRLKKIKDFAKREIGQEAKRKLVQGGGQPSGTNKTGMASAKTTDIAASADLFDIVKGQLLDEGLSEEEIKDIMLTLTPDEIMEELSDIVKRNDALNKERAMKAAQERKVPENVKAASRRQYTAGGPKDKGENKYTTQDKKTIIDYNKDKGSM